MPSSDGDFAKRYGPWAIVAGASEGLGLAFAEALARRGLNLMLIARRAAVLNDAAQSLEDRFRVEVESHVLDLSGRGAAERCHALGAGRDIGLVIYNAAYSLIGPFLEQSLGERLKELDVNCRGPLSFAHRFGEAMTRRGRGGVVLVSSLAGFQGSALVANYAATKAYNLVLGEGLWDEFRGRGVDVLVCCAGATRTPNYRRSTPPDRESRFVPVQAPEAVAEEALDALGKKPVVIPGRANRWVSSFMRRVLSRRRATIVMGRNTRKLYGGSGKP